MNKTDTFRKILQEFNSRTNKNVSYRTQLEIEHSCADAIRETKPFSKERQEITCLGYEAVDRILALREKNKGQEIQSYGASEACFSLLDQVLEHYIPSQLTNTRGSLRFFEGGVGTGAVLKHLAEHFSEKLVLSGCDVYLDREHLGDFQSLCIEDTLYNSLNALPDESIDIFYWNDVMEHMPEDEMPTLLQVLSQKLAYGGILITITPPGSMGPYDVTAFVEPYAKKALGLHLHEYYFYEVYEAMKKIYLQPYAFAEKKQKIYKIQYNQVIKQYQHHAFEEKFLLKFAYLFSGKYGLAWRRRLMHRFTNATIFIKGNTSAVR